MIRAFVLLNVKEGSEQAMLENLRGLDFVEQAYVSDGAYQLILKVKAATASALNNDVLSKIRTTSQSQSPVTLVAL
jgi:hypothetical protein